MHPIHPFLFCCLLLLGTTNCHRPQETPPETPSAAASSTVYSPTNFNPVGSQRVPLYLSTDQGKSWQEASDNLPADIQVSFVECLGGEIVMATDNRGVFLSSNDRTDWIAIGETFSWKAPSGCFLFSRKRSFEVYPVACSTNYSPLSFSQFMLFQIFR